MKRLFKAVPNRAWVLLVAVLLIAGLAALYQASLKTGSAIVLLVPDEASLARPVTQAWLDAAKEEGLSVVAMTDDAFLRYGGDRSSIAGVILPDTVHPQASELLVNQLHQYVNDGGHLFITFDAALLDTQDGHYAAAQSRLSGLAGVPYAMYEALKDKTTALGPVYGSREQEKALGFQPGKLDFKTSARLPLGELTTYGYPHLNYSHYRTEAPKGAMPMLVSAQGDTIVSKHAYGKGTVLFANLPLGYLKTRTDAYLLHRLLHHFATDLLRQPHLSPVPGAIGGLVLNLHIDSNAAHQPLLELERSGWLKQGPFSMHVTAGPDTYREGDGLGLDLNTNPPMQGFFKRMAALGHEVGSHGGWNHNVFGLEANESNRELFEPYLTLNHNSVGAAIGAEPRSYSAPMGNQPRWATEWLRQQGFKGYYSTGDNGLGPTRSFDQGRRSEPSALWAFPISSYLRIATFEELGEDEDPDVGTEDMANYLANLTRFVADQRVARLFYFHPPAATQHLPALDVLMAEARRLGLLGRFRWYTMEQLSDFLNRRELAQWQLTRVDGRSGGLTARSSDSLDQISWVFPKGDAPQFKIVKGQATLRQDGPNWIITAVGDGQELELAWE